MTNEDAAKIINAVDIEGAIVVAVCVPTRAVRVLMLKDQRTFYVEQLEPVLNKLGWRQLSMHKGTEDWESFPFALDEAVKMQQRYKLKIMAAQREAQRAAIECMK